MVMMESEQRWRRSWSIACALAVCGLVWLVLWSWQAGVSDLLSFDPRQIPTAPATAIIFLLLAVALLLLLRRTLSQGAVWYGHGAAFLSAFVGTLAALRPWLGWASPLESWLTGDLAQLDVTPVGQMSPVTGALFVITGFALLLRLPPQGRLAGARRVATLLALLVAGVGAGTVISYAVERPWWYGVVFIPVAFPTALAFLFLGAALLLAPAASPLSEPDIPVRTRLMSLPWQILTVLVALLLGVITAGYLRGEQELRRAEALKLLKSIGDLKAERIAYWRDHQWREAWLFAQATGLPGEVDTFLANPGSVPAREKLLHRFTHFTGHQGFSMVALFDTNFAARLALPEIAEDPPCIAPDLRASLLRARRLLMTDLHFTPATNHPHLDLVFPVIPDGEAAATTVPPTGFFLLRADAAGGLDQILQSWVIPSESAETLLVRRDGNRALFLNELRYQSNTALRLSIPLDPQSHVPAVMVVLGRTGTVEGVDYRGVPVLADVRAVPRSSWFLVSKIDRDELLAPLRRQAWLALALMLALAGLVGAAFWLLRKQREVRIVTKDLALERERRLLAERVEYLMKGANDLILLVDERGRILEANDRVTETTGYTTAELLRMSLAELRPASQRAELQLQLERIRQAGAARYETEVQRKNGTTFPIDVSIRRIELDGVGYLLGIARDITERQLHEREIARLTRLYATLSQINQCLVRVTSRKELFYEVCRVTVEYSGFNLAWIGWLDPATHEVVPVGRAGDDRGYLDKIKVFADDRPEGQGPVGLCLREGRPCIFNNFVDDPRALPWREAALTHGLRAVAALPLRLSGAVCGAFAVYAGEPDVFKDKEIALLEEATLDISFALDNLERTEQQRQTDAALHESEERYRLLADNADDFVSLNSADGRRLYISPSYLRVTGWTLAELEADNWRQRIHPDDLDRIERARAANLRGETTLNEYRIACKDGRWLWVEARCQPLQDADGRVEKMVLWAHDITARKLAEEKLRARNEELERFNRASTGRELRMIELKQQVNKLHLQLGQPPPYPLDFDKPPPPQGSRP